MFFSLNSFWLCSEKTGGVFWCPVCHRRSFPFKMGGEHIPVNYVFVIASPLEQPGLCPVSSEGGAPQGEPSCILLSCPSSEAAFGELRATPTPEDWMLEPSALLEKIRMLVMTVCVPFHWDSLPIGEDWAQSTMEMNRMLGLKADWADSIRLMQQLALERYGTLEIPFGRLTGFDHHTPVMDGNDFARLASLIRMYKDKQAHAMAQAPGRVWLG